MGEVSGIQLTELGSQTGPVLNVKFTKDPALGLEEGGVGFTSVMGSKGGSLLEVRADGKRNSGYGFVILSMRKLQEFSSWMAPCPTMYTGVLGYEHDNSVTNACSSCSLFFVQFL